MSEKSERKDIWKPSDDELLAETILEHIKRGSTQLKAFQEVGEQLGRTAAACGFRWNSEVRKQYEEQIKEAKQIRSSLKIKPQIEGIAKVSTIHNQVNPLDAIMDQLSRYRATFENMEKQIRELRDELTTKDTLIESLKQQIEDSKTPQEKMTDDYKSLIQIMSRARELGALDRTS